MPRRDGLAVNHATRTLSASDGTALHLETWEPQGEIRFAAAVVHGGGDHVGRLRFLVEKLTAAGGFVFGFDQRGQGSSGGPRGHVSRFEDYAADLRHVLLEVAATRPPTQQPAKLPWFLFGHSMGALTVLVYLLDHARDIPLRGAILSAPLLGLAMPVPRYKELLGAAAARVWPTFTLPSGLPPKFVSRDPEIVAEYVADPRRAQVVSAGWFSAMQQAVARVEREVSRIDTPLYWYVPTGDGIADHHANAPVFARLRDPTGNDQTLKMLDGYYHEPHNEPGPAREHALGLVVEWVLARL